MPEYNTEEPESENDLNDSILMEQDENAGEVNQFMIENDKCIFCGNDSYKKDTRLSILGSKRVQTFIDATELLQDDVSHRISQLPTSQAILNAELHYHASCFRMYERKYDRFKNSNNETKADIILAVNDALQSTIKSLESRLFLGEIFSLSDVSELLKKNYGSQFIVKNSKIKAYLINYFGEHICFVYRKKKNQSQLFHSSKLKFNVEQMYDKNAAIEEIADLLKESVEQVDFGLENRLCNMSDLK